VPILKFCISGHLPETTTAYLVSSGGCAEIVKICTMHIAKTYLWVQFYSLVAQQTVGRAWSTLGYTTDVL